ncbi:hypothetical protein CC78DRAFT_191168 [Lojkania enalia]|uniref:Uncharacterized protein n=1 Tax=Lojkania enalia TaxID=147567 RepID=A0A9P4NBC2_9PLEO|nr:hypothetical protein CC78DRAFT_191168 [Didymosphaeria enalia]
MLVLPSPASSTTPASATTSTQTNPATNSTFSTDPHKSPISSSLSSLTTTPTPTPPITQPNPTKKHNIGTAHHSCGHASIIPHPLYRNNTWESRRGSHVILEFADPTCSPPTRSSPNTTPGTTDSSHAGATTTALRSSHAAVRNGGRSATPDLPGTPGPMTRLQTTFEVIKKMGGNLGSPRIDFGAKKAEEKDKGGGGGGRGADGWGYFDALPEPVDAGDKY